MKLIAQSETNKHRFSTTVIAARSSSTKERRTAVSLTLSMEHGLESSTGGTSARCTSLNLMITMTSQSSRTVGNSHRWCGRAARRLVAAGRTLCVHIQVMHHKFPVTRSRTLHSSSAIWFQLEINGSNCKLSAIQQPKHFD